MANYIFSRDLEVAQKTEEKIASVLARVSGSTIKMLNDNRDFDILMERKGRDYYIEVKEDFMAAKTGNIAVEYECRGKPSGIQTSKSDVYAYLIHESNTKQSLYLTETKKLKEAINKRMFFREVTGGDAGSNTRMYLFRKDVFTGLSTKICVFEKK